MNQNVNDELVFRFSFDFISFIHYS